MTYLSRLMEPPILANVETIDRGKRRFLGRIATTVGAVALMAATEGCSVSTSGNVTTITLDVTKIKNYGQAGLNAAATVTLYLSSFPTLAPYMTAITAAETALSGSLSAFSDAAGSTLTINYDNADWKTRVDSILSDLSTVASAIGAAISGAGTALSATVQTDASVALESLDTLISVFKALLGLASGAKASGGMTEAQALANLGV